MKKKTAGLLLLAGVWAWTGGTAMAENTLEGSADNDYTATVNTGDSWTHVYGRKGAAGDTTVSGGHVIINGGTVEKQTIGAFAQNSNADVIGNTVEIHGGNVNGEIYGGLGTANGTAKENKVLIDGGNIQVATIVGGGIGSMSGSSAQNNYAEIGGNATVNAWNFIAGGECKAEGNHVVIKDQATVSGDICGGIGFQTANVDLIGNVVSIEGGSVTGNIYGAYELPYSASIDQNFAVKNNQIVLKDTADVSNATLYGYNTFWKEGDSVGEKATIANNTLLIDGWTGSKVQDVQNFSDITFQNIQWQTGGTVLDITDNSQTDALKDTTIHLDSISFAGGTELQTGDSMTFIEGDNLGIQEGNVDVADTFTAGVAAVGTGEMSVGDDGNTLSYTLTEVSRNTQTDLIAENRAVAAAFVNQGADIAADSLRLLDDGYHYGTQTFGAVYGNRSTYDVASDIKINGWSEIAGFGNIHEVKGGRLEWGVFYENGTGNYRTWNTFNNEMFRGDGSLLYNGGGAAVRLTKDSGMYYEASLRAGTLSSSMTNAVKDGAGNSYGFDSDSTYWGAHIGAGKLIQRGSGQWDIYGKYFHTDIDGDSFEMGGGRFSFDDVTSDRLRLGARYTADTDKAWSLYCGAAYEYEFSGDSRMKAGQFEASEQSLQGSTVFGEIGTVWGRKDSPWSMDVNLRGYAGEREGFSGMVQLAYAF